MCVLLGFSLAIPNIFVITIASIKLATWMAVATVSLSEDVLVILYEQISQILFQHHITSSQCEGNIVFCLQHI